MEEFKSDWSDSFGSVEDPECDSPDALSAAVVAIRALAAALGDGVSFEGSLRKNKLPDGRSFVSSFRWNIPSLGGVVKEEEEEEVDIVGVASPVATVEEDESSPVGGEWSFMKESPYFSFW